MNKYQIALTGFLAINIHMNLAAYNSFDSYYNAQLDDLSVIDESIKDAIRSGVVAGMLSLSPFSGQAADKTSTEKPPVPAVQVEKTYGGYTATQVSNIVARTLFMEARSDYKNSGLQAVASVIWNRAGGKPENLVKVCWEKLQFSVWKAEAPWDGGSKFTPTGYKIVTPHQVSQNKIEAAAWEACKKWAGQMVAGTFKSNIGNRNMYDYVASGKRTVWWDKMQNKTKEGDFGKVHVFGYLPEHDGYQTKIKKPTNKIYVVQAGDQLGKIATKFNTTKEKLITLNPQYKENPNLIKIGDKIVVPGVG